MANVEYMGKTFEVDEDGFLQSFDQWNDSPSPTA